MAEGSFKDYILEQLSQLSAIECRRMFGGFGLYLGGKFFGIISGDELFFKTNDETRKNYERYGMKPFAPSAKQVLKNYYEVPAEVADDKTLLAEWAKGAANVSG